MNWWIVLALVLATTLAYVPALSAPFVMDDVPVIVGSPVIRQLVPSGAPAPGSPIAGRPVVSRSLAVNYAINDLLGVDQREDPDGPHKALGFRLLNLFFHICTAALLFGVIRRAVREQTIPDDWRALADPIACVVCALWLLHPIQSEVLNYVVQRSEGLGSLFYVATLYCSIRAWDASSGASRVRWYAAAVAAAALGMGSKEIVISVPLAVVLYDRAFRLPTWSAIGNSPHGRRWFYLALAAVCVATFVLVAAGARGDTAGFAGGSKWYEYFYSQCWAIAHYLRLVVWPSSLAVDYGKEAIRGARGVPGLLLLTAFAIATLIAWTRVPRYGWFAFVGTWFFMLLAPSSSFVPIGTEIAAERRVYLALSAVLVLAVVCAEWIRRRHWNSLPSHRLFLGLMGLAAVLGAGTAVRSYTYSSSERLWRNAAKHVPENPRAFDHLGEALRKARPPQYAAAESAYRKAIAEDTTCHFGCANLASVMMVQARFAEAEPLLERALAMDQDNAPAERRLSLLLMKRGSYDRAIPHLEHLATRYPYEDHLIVLGVADLSAGRLESGIAEFKTAVRLYPESALGRFGGTLDAAARSPQALPYLQTLAMRLAEKWL